MEEDLSYYQRNKERLKQAGREYHYKHREQRIAYSKQYYQTHKTELNLRRAGHYKKKEPKSRQRAHLTKPNTSDELETRRKSFQDICLTPTPQPKWQPKPEDFTVTFR